MKISQKTGSEGASKKTITHVRGLQMLSNFMMLLYYGDASFNLTLSKLVNSPFKGARKKNLHSIPPPLKKFFSTKKMLRMFLNKRIKLGHFSQYFS